MVAVVVVVVDMHCPRAGRWDEIAPNCLLRPCWESHTQTRTISSHHAGFVMTRRPGETLSIVHHHLNNIYNTKIEKDGRESKCCPAPLPDNAGIYVHMMLLARKFISTPRPSNLIHDASSCMPYSRMLCRKSASASTIPSLARLRTRRKENWTLNRDSCEGR